LSRAFEYSIKKTKQDDPKWFMIDATFLSRAQYFVPLSLLRHIADSAESDPPDEFAYIGMNGMKAVKGTETSDSISLPPSDSRYSF
jgi:hypothetical protein